MSRLAPVLNQHALLQGDRAGICVTQLDPDLLERGLACTPGSLPCFSSAVAAVEKVRFFVGPVHSKVPVLAYICVVLLREVCTDDC